MFNDTCNIFLFFVTIYSVIELCYFWLTSGILSSLVASSYFYGYKLICPQWCLRLLQAYIIMKLHIKINSENDKAITCFLVSMMVSLMLQGVQID